MKTILKGLGQMRARMARHGEAWTLLSFLALFLGLPACHLERGGIAAPVHEWSVQATLQDAAGATYVVNGDDTDFAEGDLRTFATDDASHSDGTTPAQRIRDFWRRYLRHRVEAGAHGATFTARFGTGPWCLAGDSVRPTATLASTRSEPDVDDPLVMCGAGGAPTCANPAGTVPLLHVDPPAVTFGHAAVGTSAADVTLTLSNAGTGNLCLDGDFLILPEAGVRPDEFSRDVSSCTPMSPLERFVGRVVLSAATRPSCTVRMGFRPRNGGPRRATMQVSSNDAASPAAVALSGDGDAGVLIASPSPMCFNVASEVVGGRTCYRQGIVFSNAGPGTVTITSVTVPAPDAASWTRVHPPLSMFPIVLTPLTGQYVQVLACEPGINDSVLTALTNSTTPVIDVPMLRPASGCTPPSP
jgi:hypothetical protein